MVQQLKRADRRRLLTALLASLAISNVGWAADGGAPGVPLRYQLTPLGTLGGGAGDVRDLSNNGQAVGYALNAKNVASAFASQGGVMDNLHPPGATASAASGINDLGLVAGQATFAGQTRALMFQHGVHTGLAGLDGTAGDSRAVAVNNAGDVAGSFSRDGNSTQHAFLHSGGRLLDLGTLGGASSTAEAINGAAEVAGTSDIAGGGQHAFLHSGEMIDLGTLGGTYSSANALNDMSMVVGSSYLAGDANFRAFSWAGAGMQDLGTLGGLNSVAYGVNNFGTVVGSSDLALGSALHAFLYHGGEMFDLNSLIDPLAGYVLNYAADINDAGQIAAFGCTTSGIVCQAFLLTPVPDIASTTQWMLGAGLLGGVLWQRRRQAKAPG